MWLQVDKAGVLSLEDADNFRMFKLVFEGDANHLDVARVALAGLAEVPSAEFIWVDEAALRALKSDPVWQQNLSGMIEKARPHDWVHPDTGAIRAHIEYTNG